MSDNQGVVRVNVRPGAEPQIVGESPPDTNANDANAVDTQSESSVRVNADAGKVYSINGDDVTISEPVAVNSRVEFPSSSGVLATAHTTNGRPIPPHAVDDKSLVYFSDPAGNRIETEVSALVNAGVLTRSPDGRGYVEGQQQQQSQEQQQSGPVPFPEGHADAEELYQQLSASMPEAVFNKLLVRMMHGDIDEAAAHDLGAEFGGSSAESVQRGINTLVAAFAASAASVMQQSGVASMDIEDAYAWAREHCPEALNDANLKLVMTKDPSAFTAIAEAYLRANPPTREAVEAMGLKPYVGADGKLMIRVHGMEVSVEAATKQGWL